MNTVDVAFTDEGLRGAPVLMLSGSLGSTRAIWEPILPALGAFRVVRYDHRGHGDSPVPRGPYTIPELGADVLRLLDRLDIERVSFSGVSLGGMVGMWLARHVPDRIERLALVATSANLGPADGWRDRAALVRERGTAAVAEAVVRRWFTPAFRSRDPELALRMKAMIAGTPREGYAACCEAIAEWNFEEGLAAIGAPTLVVAGESDEATPPSHAAFIAGRIPGARLAVLSGAAHVPVAEQPEKIGALHLEHFSAAHSGKAA